MRTVVAALAIAGRILRQRVRDRSAIVFAFFMPIVLSLAFAALIPNEFDDFHTRYVVVDRDGSPLARALVDDVLGGLVAAGVADVDELDAEADAIEQVKAGDAGAGIVIPAGMGDAITRGEPVEIRLLSGEFAVSVEVARSAVAAFANEVGAAQLMVAATAVTGGPVTEETIARAEAALGEPSPIAIIEAATDKLQAGLATFYGAAMAIMFVFFAAQYGALALLADREVGTLNRLLAAPIAPATIILGSSLAGFVLGVVAMSVLVVVTTIAAGADWGPPLLVAPLIVAAVVAAMGISTLASTLVRTQRQAAGLTAIIALSMSAVGGVFIPLNQAPELMTSISQITPHAWFLRGIATLSGSNPNLIDLAAPLLVLVAMGAITGIVGLARARRSLTA
jgi:ABC-2 type transport system permease protein